MVLSASYAHLHATVRPLADEDAASRICHIRMDRWIGYARADAAIEALEELLDFPQRTRMPNLLLVGPTNNGKTMIVEKFRRAYPSIDAGDNESRVASVPVLSVQMPSGPDEIRLFASILEQLGMPYDNRARLVALQDVAVRTMRLTGVRMLVIDELHNLLSGSRSKQRQLLNLLRWLGNELRIPLVGVGTGEALQAINRTTSSSAGSSRSCCRCGPKAVRIAACSARWKRSCRCATPRTLPILRSRRRSSRLPKACSAR